MALIAIDADVVIGALDADDAHHQAAVSALRGHLASRDQLVLPASAYAESLVGPWRRGQAAADEVDAFVADLGIAVEPTTREIARRAAQLRAQHGRSLRLPDALVVATADTLGADALLTTDKRWPPTLRLATRIL